MAEAGRWVVFRPNGSPRWGSEARRQRLFDVLSERTSARRIPYWTLLDRRGNRIPMRILRRRETNDPPLLAAGEQPPVRARRLIERWTRPMAVAIYDDPVAQSNALGSALEPQLAEDLSRRLAMSVALFERLVAPTASFAELIGLPMDRVIVAANGTDTSTIQPGEWPTRPSVGMISGAAPGRGIEVLIDAARSLRSSHADLVLRLWLIATSPDGEAYVELLRQSVATESWIEIGAVSRGGLSQALAGATVMCVPHPANEYMDVALPVKLLDSMAAGRPVVVTPRFETARIVTRYRTGLVATGDGAPELASSLEKLLDDPILAAELGGNGRRAAIEHFDWQAIGSALAEKLVPE